METQSHQFVLLVLCVIFNEFAFKTLFEGWSGRHTTSHPIRVYIIYRLCVLTFHCLMVGFLFNASIEQTLTTGAVLTIVGCSELITAWFSGWVYVRTQRTVRPIHLLYVTVLVGTVIILWHGLTWQTDMFGMPIGIPLQIQFNDTLQWMLVYFLASIPSNYIIRWLVNKPEDATFADMIVSKLTTHLATAPLSEPLTLATSESSVGPTLKGGRIIGVLERWIVIALFARGEMAAIGFVFAAKSIVRYQDFTKPDFAEYYLIGTLYSVLIALGLSTLL